MIVSAFADHQQRIPQVCRVMVNEAWSNKRQLERKKEIEREFGDDVDFLTGLCSTNTFTISLNEQC